MDKEFKIITLGEKGVGRTSLLKRIVNNDFDENEPTSLGISFLYKIIDYKKKFEIKIMFCRYFPT